MKHLPRYVLATAARNEEEFIELTLKAVVAQTVRPVKWIIVSDGSTDRTDEIVTRYAEVHDWISLLRLSQQGARDFSGKVSCIDAAIEQFSSLDYDVVACLDADITFDSEHFEFLLGKLAGDSKLGIVGTPFRETGKTYDFRFSSVEHVSGACQVFRRECYEAIGGYTKSKGGGIDVIAVMSARMRGWNTRTFPERSCEHHRPMGTGDTSSTIKAEYRLGQRQYRLGFHPLWQVCRSFYQMTRKPYVIKGGALLCGYLQAMFAGTKRVVSPELAAFQQRDQMKRLKKALGLSRADHSEASASASTAAQPPNRQ